MGVMMRMKEEEWDEVIKIKVKGVLKWRKGVRREMMKEG